MKTLDEMIAVMQAAKEGKKIEYKYHDVDTDWRGVVIPDWNWSIYEYRVKVKEQEPRYVPYESAEEFLQAQQEHGLYIKFADSIIKQYIMPSFIGNMGFFSDDKRISYSMLLHPNYSWQDGTRCGKLKNE